MKDDNQLILLEGLASDVAMIQKKLTQQSLVEDTDVSLLIDEIRFLRSEVHAIKERIVTPSNAQVASNDQQRLIDLRIQLDRISIKLGREDNLLRYYLSPPKILLATLLIVLLSLLAGAISHSLYLKQQLNESETKTIGK